MPLLPLSADERNTLFNEIRKGVLVQEEAILCENNNNLVLRIPKEVAGKAGLKCKDKVVFKVRKNGKIKFFKKDTTLRLDSFHRKILHAMRKGGEFNPSQLSRELKLSWNTVEERLNTLEELGLVEMEPDENPKAKKKRNTWRLLDGTRH